MQYCCTEHAPATSVPRLIRSQWRSPQRCRSKATDEPHHLVVSATPARSPQESAPHSLHVPSGAVSVSSPKTTTCAPVVCTALLVSCKSVSRARVPTPYQQHAMKWLIVAAAEQRQETCDGPRDGPKHFPGARAARDSRLGSFQRLCEPLELRRHGSCSAERQLRGRMPPLPTLMQE